MLKRLKPAHPAIPVDTPAGGRLQVDGETVQMDTYWHRRLRDGSVVEVPPAAPFTPAPEAPPATDSAQADPAAVAAETDADSNPTARRGTHKKGS